MPLWVLGLGVVGGILLLCFLYLLFRLTTGLPLLQQQVETLRERTERGMEQMGGRLAESAKLVLDGHTMVGERLDRAAVVVGEVQGSLGRLEEATRHVLEVGQSVAGLEDLLKPPQIRGGLGETLLEQLLAQILPREHFALQYTFRSGEKVDAVLKIGEGLVPVDAKFPLENFRRMVEETEEEKRRHFRRAFARDVKDRVLEIARKYILPDEGTFDFALMYIPAENVYYETIVREEDAEAPVAAFALEQRVILTSPNTLYAYLQAILLGLKGLRIERNAREILTLLSRLQGDVQRFRDHFEVVGKHLTNAKNKYDEAVSALATVEAKLEGLQGGEAQKVLPGGGAEGRGG